MIWDIPSSPLLKTYESVYMNALSKKQVVGGRELNFLHGLAVKILNKILLYFIQVT